MDLNRCAAVQAEVAARSSAGLLGSKLGGEQPYLTYRWDGRSANIGLITSGPLAILASSRRSRVTPLLIRSCLQIRSPAYCCEGICNCVVHDIVGAGLRFLCFLNLERDMGNLE